MNIYKYFSMFIGYPRSGHTLVGAILNAHPEILISHEYDVIKHIEDGANFKSIELGIIQRNKWFQERNNEWSGYSYHIPSQYQNKTTGFDVIGDKKGGRTSDRLVNDFSLLSKTINTIPQTIKWIHVCRNPFNIISTMTKYRDSIEHNIDVFIKYHETAKKVETNVGRENFYTFYHEDLISDSLSCISDLVGFLSKQCSPDYLKSCSSILFNKPKKTFCREQWSSESIQMLNNYINNNHLLSRYSLDNNS